MVLDRNVEFLEVDFESEYWKTIVNRILIFANYFQKFRKDKKLQKQLLQEGVDKFNLDISKENLILYF